MGISGGLKIQLNCSRHRYRCRTSCRGLWIGGSVTLSARHQLHVCPVSDKEEEDAE